MSGWHFVAREDELAAPGDWINAPLTPAGVVVVRQQDGGLRAFHAVCTHRGAAFLDAECGSGARFTCPYHGFQFELTGRACANVPDLREVQVAERLGFVFVSLEDASPLEEEWPPWLESLAPLRRAHRVAYDVKARRQVVIENFQESLHFPTVHPALEALTPSALAETWPRQGPWLGGIMPIVETAETVSLTGERNGRPFITEERRLVHDAVRLPNLLTSLQPDYLLTFALFEAEGRTRVVASIHVHEDAPEDVADVIDFWARVHEEDRIACERQERGLRSLEMRAKYTDVEEGAAAIAAMMATPPRPSSSLRKPAKHVGILGRPYADLRDHIDTSSFPELHAEITRGLAQVETRYTGGTLKWMGVCAPWTERDGYRDAMHAIQAMSAAERAELVALGDHEDVPDDAPLGDETPYPFSRAQERFLEQRHGAYFPWKASYHLLENDRWDDKHSGDGKEFGEEAREHFPKTIAFIESLPFTEIGRVVIFGLLPNDHAPAHRDSEPGQALAIAQSISFAPGGRKRFFLTTPDGREEVVVDSPIYWFNDMDWHGVHADPFFRYSVRVDGVFDPAFLNAISRQSRRGR